MDVIINQTPTTPSLNFDEYTIVRLSGKNIQVLNRTNTLLFFEIKPDLTKPAGIAAAWIKANESSVVNMYTNYKYKGKTLYIKYTLYDNVTNPRKKVKILENDYAFTY